MRGKVWCGYEVDGPVARRAGGPRPMAPGGPGDKRLPALEVKRMSSAAKLAEKRAIRRESGVCVECGRPPAAGHMLCERHFSEAQQRLMDLRRKRRRAGLCLTCGESPAAPGRTRCADCLRVQNILQKERYKALRAAGVCVACGRRRAQSGKAKCLACTRTAAETYRRRQTAKARRGQLFRILASETETWVLGQGGQRT